MADAQLLAAFRAHIERRIALDDIPVMLRDPWTVADLLKDNTNVCHSMPANAYRYGQLAHVSVDKTTAPHGGR